MERINILVCILCPRFSLSVFVPCLKSNREIQWPTGWSIDAIGLREMDISGGEVTLSKCFVSLVKSSLL